VEDTALAAGKPRHLGRTVLSRLQKTKAIGRVRTGPAGGRQLPGAERGYGRQDEGHGRTDEKRHGKKTFQDYQKIMDMFNKVKQSSNNGVLATLMSLDFELPVENKTQVLVDKKFDGKQINPQLAQAVIYANFTIHIENKSNPVKKLNNKPTQ
jgi:hypothetical protein